MSNELVVIDPKNALTVLTSSDYVEQLIFEVGEKVKNLDGGNMETGVGRKAIVSNANKAKKSKTALNKIIDDLIQKQKDQIDTKTKDEQLAIEKLKENKNRLGAGLDNIYQTTRKEVTDFETELKRIKEEKEAIEAAEKMRVQVEADHEIAIILNEKFDMEAEIALKAEQEAERLRIEQEEKARLEREEQIRKEAEEKAKADAEKERLAAIEKANQAERDRIASEERAKLEAEQAEKKRLDDIEAAKQAEIKRIADEAAKKEAEEAKRKADEEHYKKVMLETNQYFVDMGISQEMAFKITESLRDGLVPNTPKMIF